MEQAQRDIERITQDLSGFGKAMVLIWPDGQELPIIGLHTKHHMAIDPETNLQINVKNAHASFSETPITLAGMSVRNAQREVSLAGFKIRAVDSAGLVWTYVVTSWFPDESIGLIVCILGDYEQN
jgi:hypothetical protein